MFFSHLNPFSPPSDSDLSEFAAFCQLFKADSLLAPLNSASGTARGVRFMSHCAHVINAAGGNMKTYLKLNHSVDSF